MSFENLQGAIESSLESLSHAEGPEIGAYLIFFGFREPSAAILHA